MSQESNKSITQIEITIPDVGELTVTPTDNGYEATINGCEITRKGLQTVLELNGTTIEEILQNIQVSAVDNSDLNLKAYDQSQALSENSEIDKRDYSQPLGKNKTGIIPVYSAAEKSTLIQAERKSTQVKPTDIPRRLIMTNIPGNERPTSQVATELAKNTGGVIVNSSILAFRLAFESGKAARYAYHNTNEFVKKYTTNTIRLTLLATAATTSAALIWNATHPNKPNTESGQVVLSDKFLHPMKDGAVYNSAKVENRTITINGVTKTRPHRGIDSALSPEEIRYIRASRSGVITNISTNGEGSSGGYGTLIEIDTVESVAGTFDGLGYRNAHLDISDKWKVGDRINQGDIIGTMANHGRGTGPHDHFEILNRTNDKVTIGNLKTKLKGASAQMGKKISEGKIGNSHYSVWQPTKPKLEIKLDKIIPDPSQHLNPCDVIEGGCPVLKSRFSKPEYINAKTLDSKTQTAKK
jgi:murein DD-endopeptidase MepM/ murein hydrolase activator NlpD